MSDPTIESLDKSIFTVKLVTNPCFVPHVRQLHLKQDLRSGFFVTAIDLNTFGDQVHHTVLFYFVFALSNTLVTLTRVLNLILGCRSTHTSEPGQSITVILGSQSALKVTATTKAFETEARRLAGDKRSAKVEVIAIKAASNINEQPFGYEETLLGARNRLAGTKAEAAAKGIKANFAACIENGILEFKDGVSVKPTYIDVPFVLVEDLASGRQYFAMGAGLPFPNELFEEAQRRGFDKGHVGMVIGEKYGDACNKNDPHSFMTANRITRIEMMEQVRFIIS
jgi:non-canonical (house-cleaning) NTP pyrophosphatase